MILNLSYPETQPILFLSHEFCLGFSTEMSFNIFLTAFFGLNLKSVKYAAQGFSSLRSLFPRIDLAHPEPQCHPF